MDEVMRGQHAPLVWVTALETALVTVMLEELDEGNYDTVCCPAHSRIDGELTLLFSDISYVARIMRRAPLFTATIVLTVMLAIAANTAIFSVVNAVMLRPLPYEYGGDTLKHNE